MKTAIHDERSSVEKWRIGRHESANALEREGVLVSGWARLWRWFLDSDVEPEDISLKKYVFIQLTGAAHCPAGEDREGGWETLDQSSTSKR